MQLAFRILRPRTIELLLSLGAAFGDSLCDPDGLAPLHRIAGQCLTRRIPIPAQSTTRMWIVRFTPQPDDFLDSCKKMWRRFTAEGMDVNAADGTAAGNPPLFHYLAHHAETVGRRRPFEFKLDTGCHVASFEDFFGAADLAVRNTFGDTALHVVSRNAMPDHTALDFHARRPDEHDAVVFRFLIKEKGLDPLVEDGKGRSALDIAQGERRTAIMKLFQPQKG